MEKLNIAEILKDCPKGMELDSPIIDNLHFDCVTDDNIKCYVISDICGICNIVYFKHDGSYLSHHNAKCVIFPKGKTTWEGFQRPFKDGDVVVDTLGGIHIMRNASTSYCYFDRLGILDKTETSCVRVNHLATEEEKQKLFDAIKANGYKWNAETKTLEKLIEPKFKVGDRIKSKNIRTNYLNDNHIFTITEISRGRYWSNLLAIEYIENQDDWELVPNKFDVTTLKPFDKVLVRDTNNYCWHAGFYSHYTGTYFYTTNGLYAQCIPFEDNKHLLGTKDDCDEYFKTWE